MFRLGLYSTLFNQFFRLQGIRYDLPGLEIKYACEAAESVGANITYLGAELDSNTSKRLAHETRTTLIDYILMCDRIMLFITFTTFTTLVITTFFR